MNHLINRAFEHGAELGHGAVGIALDHQRLEARENLHLLHHFVHIGIGTEILFGKAIPETRSRSIGHVVYLHRPALVIEAGAEIDHTDIEHRIAIAEIAQVNEIRRTHSVLLREDTITELQVAMQCRIRIRHSRYIIMDLLFLLGCEIRVVRQHLVVALLAGLDVKSGLSASIL